MRLGLVLSRSSLALLALAAGLAVGTPMPALAAPDPAIARAAVAAAEASRWAEAADRAEQAGDPLLLRYVTWLRLRDDDAEASFAELASFVEQHPDWPSIPALRARAERAIGPADSAAAAKAFLLATPPATCEGRTRLAGMLLDDGRTEEARRLAAAIWIEDDLTVADEASFLARLGSLLDGRDDVARLDRLLWDGEQAQARRMLPRVDPAGRALAEARMALRANAARADKLLHAVPARLRDDPGLVFEQVRRDRLRARDDAAIARLLEVRDDAARPDLWWNERQILARRAMAGGHDAIAYRLVDGHGLREGPAFVEAEWLAGWLALRFVGDPSAAYEHFGRVAGAVRTPISRARAAYWQGRAAAALGRHADARRHYGDAAQRPTTYYGQLAAGELGLMLQPVEATEVAATSTGLAGSEPARVAAMLCDIGEAERAAPFLTRLAADHTGDATAQVALVAIAMDCHRPDLLVRVAKAGTLDREPDLRASHPVPRVAGLTRTLPDGPDAATRLAVARQESLFDVDAVSPAGARGLLQLMPATAKAVAARLDLPYSPGRLTADPDLNARLGAFYLQQQLDRFDGELAMALAAYNAGPARVDAWIAANGDPRGADAHALIDWIESIPFSETRNYVQRVLENRAVYSVVLRAPVAGRISAVPETPMQGELEADATPARGGS